MIESRVHAERLRHTMSKRNADQGHPDNGDQLVRPMASERMMPAIQIHSVPSSAIAMPGQAHDSTDVTAMSTTGSRTADREIKQLDRHLVLGRAGLHLAPFAST